MNNQLSRRLFTGVAIGVALIGVCVWWQWADMFASHWITRAHRAFFIVGPLALLVVLAVGCFASAAMRRQASTRKAATLWDLGAFLLGGAFVVTLGFTIKFWVMHSYHVDQEYVKAIKVVDAPAPRFAQRTAYPVATASARNNMQDTTGELQAVRFVSAGHTDSWNALIQRRATLGGYQAVQVQHIALTGLSNDPTLCQFNTQTATRRLGGMFSHSLDRAIYHLARGTNIDHGDAYGLCAGPQHNLPEVVVPLKKTVGWLYAHDVPAGVAVYNGLTGTTKVFTHVKPGQIPGPVYPMSLAAKTRQAAAAIGSFSDYWHKRTGYEETSGRAGDPNGSNRAEMSLRPVSGGGDFVTPLTPPGASDSIIAEGVVANDHVSAGQYNTLVVHKLPHTRISNETSAQRIRGDYGDLPEWAAGMRVYEITPMSSSKWVASLGQNQDINYRVLMAADGSSCIERADGTTLRCGKVTGIGDNGVGVALQNGGTTSPTTGVPAPTSSTQLAGLTDQQLVQLQAEVTSEILRRSHANTTGAGSSTAKR